MGMPPRAPNAGPLTGNETLRLFQDGRPVNARVSDVAGVGPHGASAYDIAVANGFVGSEAGWLASLQGRPGESIKGSPGVDSKVPGPPGASAYEVAKAAGFSGTQTDWLAGLRGLKGDAGAPTRTEIVTVTSNASGQGSIVFNIPFATPPILVPLLTWAGAQMIVGSASAVTINGATATVMRSKGTLLLTAGPFEVAPAGAVASFVAIGR